MSGSTRLLPFVDIEALVVSYLNAHLQAPWYAATDLPDPIEAGLPFLRVLRSPGYEDEVTARPHVDIEALAATRSAVWDLAGAAHNLLRVLGGTVVDGQLVDSVVTVQDPMSLPWSVNVPRSVAVYEIHLRPVP